MVTLLTNLLKALESWTDALDNGYGVDLLLYYRKAFDSISHEAYGEAC